jgi:hypothetical protein
LVEILANFINILMISNSVLALFQKATDTIRNEKPTHYAPILNFEREPKAPPKHQATYIRVALTNWPP